MATSTITTKSSGRVTLDDGTTSLPFETRPSPLDIIIGHGLGAPDPAEKSHHNDISTDLWTDVVRCLIPQPSSVVRSGAAGHPVMDGTAVLYTARGHGDSYEWDSKADVAASVDRKDDATNAGNTKDEQNGVEPDVPFRWPNLAEDMLSVANSCGLGRDNKGGGGGGGMNDRFAAFGQSMGAASALYMTIHHPHRISGLILARPPRAWEGRQSAAPGFVASSEELRRQGRATYLPLLGAANTDLPPRDGGGVTTTYGTVKCPVLVLSHGEDEAHPVETGRALAELMPHARLEVARNEEAARREWPQYIADWLVDDGLV